MEASFKLNSRDARIQNEERVINDNRHDLPYPSIEAQPIVITSSKYYDSYTCCGIFPLKTGCLIIGYYNLVSAICLIIASFVGLIIGNKYMNSNGNTEQRNLGLTLVIFCSILLILLVLHLIFTILLVVGVHKHKRSYVKAYLIYSSILFAMSLLSTITNLARIKNFSIVGFLFNIIQTCVSGYFLYIINVYTNKMRNDIGS